MTILGQIRSRPILLMGIIALALLAFLVNPTTINKFFGKNPDILGSVNGDKITREEFQDQLSVLQQQAEQQGQPTTGLEEQAWQMMLQSKLIAQQFDKMGFKMTDELFWNQIQYDPMFAQNPQYFDERGNFKVNDLKKQIAELEANPNPQMANIWPKMRKAMEYRVMARQVFGAMQAGITTGKKEAEYALKTRDEVANIDYIKIDYTSYLAKNPIKVTRADLEAYIAKHPNTFKVDPSVNIGVVTFSAKPSAADESAAMANMTNLLSGNVNNTGENFQNTKSDSMFVMMNSEARFDGRYIPEAQLPPSLLNFAKTAAPGQILGPFKEGNVLVLSKLQNKKPSDSVLSRHILIAYKGAERSTATRTKEQAKKIADSLFAAIKSNPAAFAANLKSSDEPGAVERGGDVGWVTPNSPFDPAYLNYLMSNPKGSTGLVESNFGFHIINIEDKKPGPMSYKLANIVKQIQPSAGTTATADKNARRFIQQVQGKSFNDFANLAKKSGYAFNNPKMVKRFDAAIPGAGTTKDAEIITWAFNKDREKGNTEMFTAENGDRVVVIYNSRQDRGTADAELVREQIEPIVKNQLAAKQISDKISAAKAGGLDAVSKLFASPKMAGSINLAQPMLNGSVEPKVAGAAFALANGKVSQPIQGMGGVYVIAKKNQVVNKQPGDVKQMQQSITQQTSQYFLQMLMKSLQDGADIKDYRAEVWDKQPQAQQ